LCDVAAITAILDHILHHGHVLKFGRAESEHPEPAKCGLAVDLTGADDCGAAQSLTYFCPNRSLRGQSQGNYMLAA
jgi:hypothetical protein